MIVAMVPATKKNVVDVQPTTAMKIILLKQNRKREMQFVYLR
jgi:hypothetical protein